ncbi:MAG: pentapeptide repeat-containing protein [Chloroflexi bacterium]|nr:pentapeptide repeat-containing protein [Chloroflexota bacterium]MCL5273453.1 pentapeptide repeat-containing protein [Chloroflexota bacterium]
MIHTSLGLNPTTPPGRSRSGAQLSGAQLSGAQLSGAQLSGAQLRVLPNCVRLENSELWQCQ